MKKILIFLSEALAVTLALPYFIFEQPDQLSGTNIKGSNRRFSEAHLLVDRTVWDEVNQNYIQSHVIFDTILTEIESAEIAIIVDFFL